VTTVHLDPIGGASGDMLLGALVDAGVPVAALREAVAGLGMGGWELDAEDTTRGGLGACHVRVHAPEDGVVRTWAHVRQLLTDAPLASEVVRARALATFQRLADAEARVHRTDADLVHFHEVGALDALVDVVGVCAGFAHLAAERVTCSPVPQGIGMARGSHGLIPLPAPAVLELLAGAPTYSTGIPAELCTPTGAALLAEWVDVWTELPPLTVRRIGYGAGSRDLEERPNVLRLIVGDAAGPAGAVAALLLETTIDDLPGELVPPVLDALRAAGADDAWARPVTMKKGRPGVEIVCLAPPAAGPALRRVLFRETTTLGTRERLVDKWMLDRDWVEVVVAGHAVRLKVGRLDGEVVNVAPEFDDCAAAAAATGLPIKEVVARARAAWNPGGADLERPPPASA
jgi:pyridinium-3,5-bisthiocarboxylic acid mononucleotide nickel chelatase